MREHLSLFLHRKSGGGVCHGGGSWAVISLEIVMTGGGRVIWVEKFGSVLLPLALVVAMNAQEQRGETIGMLNRGDGGWKKKSK